jgi:hypothetical protein
MLPCQQMRVASPTKAPPALSSFIHPCIMRPLILNGASSANAYLPKIQAPQLVFE